MSSSYFASRHKKDLSTNMIRAKIAHRKSLSQKENRHKEYERNRHFGLKDVNIPNLEGRILVELDETCQELVPEKANVKPTSTKTVVDDQRKRMLQKYKEEKQLRKLKEQREKAKRGVFKVGLYRPDMPCFLSSKQSAVKTEPKQPVGPTLVRMTRSATQVAKQVAGTVSSTTTRKPTTGATHAKDLIRTAVGQTRLLMKERFKQFEGLVNDCEYKRGEKETTCTDLDGFWDMVSFQIEDVNQKFTNLSKLEESGWQNSSNNINRKVFRKKVFSGVASKPNLDDGRRIAARNRLAAIKNAMRERIKQEEHAEAAASVVLKEPDKIVFDAGFFRIESPVKSFSG
ncbi:Disks large-associated protein 5 [Tupaia chinensis]|uniref:Disks large-associated protein 5 n=1 Tax=Tupaia chinensis TaxID=246437 RepID=L9JDK5_TUPCH|nr:Disks large-associated protein 5 [Tupaia chinensis]